MVLCPGWLQLAVLAALCVTTFGECTFPLDWAGQWFQYAEGQLTINSTSFGRKGDCEQTDGDDKYIVYDRKQNDLCRSCLAVYKRHNNVIQYKESNCLKIESLEELCQDIRGDQPLMTMYRVENAIPEDCPFEYPMYRFSYSRGSAECSNPPSRMESCTDNSKILVSFAACTDVAGTESGVEEWNCLATWKEGSDKYLIAKIKNNDNMLSVEESYRCFIYDWKAEGEGVYQVAQSADATCTSVSSPVEGSKTMLLNRIEVSHERCKFPSWVASHHHYHWHSLDNSHSYHFTHKNATLRITREHGQTESRLVCHHVVTNSTDSMTLVAHATIGCKNGYICMVFNKKHDSIIQLVQSNETVQEPTEACNSAFYHMSPPVTLVTAVSQDAKCSLPGRFIASGPVDWTSPSQACHINSSILIGCSEKLNVISLQNCDTDSYTDVYNCHGSWSENQATYMVVSPVSRQPTEAKRYCLIFTQTGRHATLHRLEDSCILSPNHLMSPLNLTFQGPCVISSSHIILPTVWGVIAAVTLAVNLR